MKNQVIVRKIGRTQGKHYNKLFEKYSYSPQAVGSENEINKTIRYSQLSKVFSHDETFSLHDVGHGLGHYYEYLKKTFPNKNIDYSGSEVCFKFVDFCQKKYPSNKFYHRNLAENVFPEKYNYIIYGGTFYHRENYTHKQWLAYLQAMLINGFRTANKGITFNLLTSYCDYFKDDLFYCDPNYIIKFVTKHLSRFFSIDHSYPLYEYTVCVYKESYIKNTYPDSLLTKYFKDNNVNSF